MDGREKLIRRHYEGSTRKKKISFGERHWGRVGTHGVMDVGRDGGGGLREVERVKVKREGIVAQASGLSSHEK